MDKRLRRVERLRKREEIRSVLRQRGEEGAYCILHARPNFCAVSRLGVVVGRAVGKAVIRNKAKRRLRDIFRHLKGQFIRSIDLVIRAKRQIREATYQELVKEICDLLQHKKFM